ncbi:DUF4097 family beta strand repeat protein [Anaerococcus sp. AGMB00486]|uniref:DUF4097 family beta strand repeat protein n=2 Tax=Anaerococcus TaxID=165779 RepID=A0ABX2N855_9FIRM|nr:MULTISPECIES: DUF4097 family beta strand repeat-containing protein [Anaerococcus]MSS77317.1 DUF4097 domain-containing protein [Anaerococcus porci]NVF10881.1 DUF4097 family beta strand repeat protein [Anaerococcus faecalis]
MSKENKKEKNKFKLDKKQIGLGLFALLILALIFFLTRNINFSRGSEKSSDEISENSYNSSKIMRVDLNDIKEIQFDLKTCDVRIEESSTNPYVEYTNLYKGDSSYEVDVNFKDGKLIISSNIKGKELYMKNKIQIVRIFLPKDSTIEKLSGSVGAGDIKISSLNVNDMDLKLESGNISFENSKLVGSVTNNVGSILVKESELKDTLFKTSIGNIRLEDSKLLSNESFTSDNGDIIIKTKDPIESFNIKAKLNIGNFVIGNVSYRNILDGYVLDNKKDKTIDLTTKVGDILFNKGEGDKIEDEEYFTSPKSNNSDENFETPVDKSEINSPINKDEKDKNVENNDNKENN